MLHSSPDCSLTPRHREPGLATFSVKASSKTSSLRETVEPNAGPNQREISLRFFCYPGLRNGSEVTSEPQVHQKKKRIKRASDSYGWNNRIMLLLMSRFPHQFSGSPEICLPYDVYDGDIPVADRISSHFSIVFSLPLNLFKRTYHQQERSLSACLLLSFAAQSVCRNRRSPFSSSALIKSLIEIRDQKRDKIMECGSLCVCVSPDGNAGSDEPSSTHTHSSYECIHLPHTPL